MRRLAPHYAPRDKPAVTGSEVAAYLVALSALWAVSDWPLHDIAEVVLDSVHMVEHITIALILPPLVIVGVPGWLWRVVLEPIMALARRITHPIKGLIAFNAVFAATHWPPILAIQNICLRTLLVSGAAATAPTKPAWPQVSYQFSPTLPHKRLVGKAKDRVGSDRWNLRSVRISPCLTVVLDGAGYGREDLIR